MSESAAVDLLRAQLELESGATPESLQRRLDLLGRITAQLNADRDFALKDRDAKVTTWQAKLNTPLVIALTGILTIAANFAVAYMTKDQDTAAQVLVANENARLTAENSTLTADLTDAQATANQQRTLQARDLEFQYTMIDRIMSSVAVGDMTEKELEIQRARQLEFLRKLNLLSLVDEKGLKELTGEALSGGRTVAIGFPTLPTAQAIPAPLGSNLTKAPLALIDKVLGPPGRPDQGCGVPLVKVPVPFEMVASFDQNQSVTSFPVHQAAASHFTKALALLKERGLESHARLFGGVYIPRPPRTTSRVSVHSWGIAIDFDPAGNQVNWGRDRASLPTDFARTMEEAGFLSSGLAYDRDWMHFELSLEALGEIEANGYKPWDGVCAADPP